VRSSFDQPFASQQFNAQGRPLIRVRADVAKALALGATVGGIARPFLQAQARGQLVQAIETVLEELRVACLLTGSATVQDLRSVPRVVGGRLRAWQA